MACMRTWGAARLGVGSSAFCCSSCNIHPPLPVRDFARKTVDASCTQTCSCKLQTPLPVRHQQYTHRVSHRAGCSCSQPSRQDTHGIHTADRTGTTVDASDTPTCSCVLWPGELCDDKRLSVSAAGEGSCAPFAVRYTRGIYGVNYRQGVHMACHQGGRACVDIYPCQIQTVNLWNIVRAGCVKYTHNSL
jgi:hypothetical protein